MEFLESKWFLGRTLGIGTKVEIVIEKVDLVTLLKVGE